MNETNNDSEQALALVKKDVDHWLSNIVVGLGLCPFAATPLACGTVRLALFSGDDTEKLLVFIQQEFQRLEKSDVSEIETTLVVAVNCLDDFYEYNQYIDMVEQLIKVNRWEGMFQVASFHPNYQFAETGPDDRENLTNRAPYPIFHLLREASLEAALAHVTNPESIPDNNIACMENMADDKVAQLFYYLGKSK